MRTMGFLLAAFCLMTLSSGATAQEKSETPTASSPSKYVYGTFLYHAEKRDYERERHIEGFLGIDTLLNPETNVWIGARAGFYNENVLTSIPVGVKQTRPAVGFHVFKLIPLEKSISLKAGGGADVLYAGKDFDFPLWLYMGGEAGFRVNLTSHVYAEIPFELGFFPFFDGTPFFSKVGFQLGFGF